MKILVRTTIDQFSGYGRDGIGILRGLLDRGHDIRLSPTYVGVPLPRDIAGLLTYPHDAPFDVALYHLPPEEVDLTPPDASASRRNVFWTMWGWPDLPDDPWVSTLAARTNLFDHVVAYDDNSVGAFESVLGEGRVKRVLGGYSADDWEVHPSEKTSETFFFGMVGRLTVRKGVYLAYRAFNQLKEKHGSEFNAALILNSTEPVFPESAVLAPDVHVLVNRLLPSELHGFYDRLDCLLAPSYAEGKHLPPIEALSCGVPVILSDITGHRAWATSDMVTWVSTTPAKVAPGYTGGEVSVDDLADAMWEHYTNRFKHEGKAISASRSLPAMLDWTKCLERLGRQTGLLL